MSKINLQLSHHASRHIFAVRKPVTSPVKLTRSTAIHVRRRYLRHPRYAYVTLVMCGDEYAIGAAVLGWSLRKFDVKHELVVMVTSDVSCRVRKLLMKIYDRVETVEYIQSRPQSILRGHEYRQEKAWMKYCLTKGNMMKYIEYDKIAWMDADMLALANLDEIFQLSTPSGICTSIRDDERWHGERLPEAEIKESLLNNYGIKGCIMILRPCVRHYLMVKSQKDAGHGNAYLGPDEYFYTMLYKEKWHHLNQKYGCSKVSENNGIQPAALHFNLAKPWRLRDAECYASVEKWWAFANDLMNNHPEFVTLLKIIRKPCGSSRSWLFLSPIEQTSYKLRNDYSAEKEEPWHKREERRRHTVT